MKYDVAIIGGGPAGYTAAEKAAAGGLSTVLFEKNALGGVCLNEGCVPTKTLLYSAKVFDTIKHAPKYAVSAENPAFDFPKIIARKNKVVKKLTAGIRMKMKENGVEVVSGEAEIKGRAADGTIAVASGEVVYEAANLLICTGSETVIPPIPGLAETEYWTSREALLSKELPASLVIIGGGVISVEFATVYSALGSKVTILEAMPRLVPNMDKEIAQNLKLILKKRGVESHTSAAVQGVHMEGDTCVCTFVEKEKEQTVEAEYVLCAVGRCPNTDGLFAEGAAPDMERGRVLVNDKFESSIPGVYAIGDLIFGAQLAHAASAQGIVVAEQLAGKEPSVNLDVVPGCVYTDPEIASAGITEDAAKEQGIKVKTGKFIMSANGKSLITKEERGFIKIVTDEETNVILGAQMMCARATDMIGEFVTAIANKMTVAQLLKGMRAHPTYNEGIGEALEEAEGGAIHVVPKKKK